MKEIFEKINEMIEMLEVPDLFVEVEKGDEGEVLAYCYDKERLAQMLRELKMTLEEEVNE